MKKRFKRFGGLAIFALCCALSDAVGAETIHGTVTFVGTIGEFREPSGFLHAQFRLRLSESTCGSDQTRKDRWIHVKSGRMDGSLQHNSANFRNAYNTAMSGLLARTVLNMQLDGAPTCNDFNEINLWNANVGLYPK
jgi:hypothetical protein